MNAAIVAHSRLSLLFGHNNSIPFIYDPQYMISYLNHLKIGVKTTLKKKKKYLATFFIKSARITYFLLNFFT